MCTVSYVCSNGKIIITSNRDEQVERPATAPQNFLVNQKNIIFPKDPKAGGSWFAIDEEANVLVLLNGAAEKHVWNPPYRRSRGLILLDIISSPIPLEHWESIDLNEIEPFTLVLYAAQKLYQLRWNGDGKECIKLDEKGPHIWSSSTLYTVEAHQKHIGWFNQFLDTKPTVEENEMFNFHRYTEETDGNEGLVINRNEKLKTLSITQVVIDKNKISMVHHDLVEKNMSNHSFMIV